jgi:sugar phosphate isomerase/epimerase
MELGMCMASLLDRDWEPALALTQSLGIAKAEAMGGGHTPRRHYDPLALAASAEARRAFTGAADRHGIEVVALGCYGNVLDPDAAGRRAAREDMAATMRAAAELGIGIVTSNAGCPAGAPGDSTPNWIVHSLFPGRWDAAYAWQWEQCVLPYWREVGKLAEEHDVVVALEPMGGDVLYNLATFARLRERAGERILCHVDPSHLWWQGIEIADFIAGLGGAIGFAHAKDVSYNAGPLRTEGVLPSCAYDDWDARSWSMRALGYGHDDLFWREYAIALRRGGYDGVLAIEFQEPYMTVEDGLRKSVEMLRRALPEEPPPSGNWFEMYSS